MIQLLPRPIMLLPRYRPLLLRLRVSAGEDARPTIQLACPPIVRVFTLLDDLNPIPCIE